MIYHVEDSFALIERLRAGSFDHVITDPPYPDHVQDNMMSGTTLEKVDLGFAPLMQYAFARSLRDIASRWVVMFCAIEAFGEIRNAVNEKPRKKSQEVFTYQSFARGCVWYKPNSMGQITGDRPAAACEGVAVYHSLAAPKRWNGHGAYGFYKCNGTRGIKDRHPNQKPLDLCLRIVASFTDRGDHILDPFAGSGSIGEACAMLGRRYTGFDFDAGWVEKGNERIRAFKHHEADEWALSLCSARKEEI